MVGVMAVIEYHGNEIGSWIAKTYVVLLCGNNAPTPYINLRKVFNIKRVW